MPSQHRKHAGWCPPGFEELRANKEDAVAYFERVKKVAHPLSKVEVGLPTDLKCAIDMVCEKGSGIVEWRETRMAAFEKAAARLEGWSSELRSTAPVHVREAAGAAHVALYAACIDGIGWPHQRFALDHCLRGFTIVGEAEDTGLFCLRDEEEMRERRADAVLPGELFKTNKTWVGQLVAMKKAEWKRATRTGDAKAIARITAAWDASVKEVSEKGTSVGPFSVSDLNNGKTDLESVRFGRYRPGGRHAVWQGSKWRPCDNFKRNGTNKARLGRERMATPGVDTPAAVGRYVYDSGVEAGWDMEDEMNAMGGGGDDEPDAYRHSSTRTPEHTVVLLVNPADGEVYGFRPFGHNFGLEAAIINYNSKPELLCAVARRMFAVICEHYFDDYWTGGPRFELGPPHLDPEPGEGEWLSRCRYPSSSQGMLARMMVIFGCSLAMPKHVGWRSDPAFSGVVTDFSRLMSEGVIALRCKPTTVEKVRSMVDGIVAAGEMTPSEASSLRGKLLWVWLYQKLGKAEWSAIVERQRAASASGGDDGDGEGRLWPLSLELEAALGFVRGMLDGALPDVVMRAYDVEEPPVVVLSDAFWKPDSSELGVGAMAFVVWVPLTGGGGKLAYAETAASQELLGALQGMRAQQTFITPLEALALQGAYLCRGEHPLADVLRDKMVIHCADNKAANAGAVKAFSGSRDLAAITRETRWAWHELGIDPWVEFVASKANLADWPSRGLFMWLKEHGGVRVEFPAHRIGVGAVA